MPGEPNGRRRRVDGRGTQDALLDAGMSIWSEDGLDAVTMNAVAARAGKTRGTVYHHFADRGALIVALQSHLDERLTSLFDEAVAPTRDPYLLVAGIAADSPELLKGYLSGLISGDPKHDKLIGAAREYFRSVEQRGGLHDGITADHAALFGISMWITGVLATGLADDAGARKAAARDFARTFRTVMETVFIKTGDKRAGQDV